MDYAERDHKNRTLGRAGEEWALAYLQQEPREAGRPDLAERVDWVSERRGDGLGFDIASFSLSGKPESIEVKTATGGIASPFLVTPTEIGASGAEPRFVLMRIFNFGASILQAARI